MAKSGATALLVPLGEAKVSLIIVNHGGHVEFLAGRHRDNGKTGDQAEFRPWLRLIARAIRNNAFPI